MRGILYGVCASAVSAAAPNRRVTATMTLTIVDLTASSLLCFTWACSQIGSGKLGPVSSFRHLDWLPNVQDFIRRASRMADKPSWTKPRPRMKYGDSIAVGARLEEGARSATS